MTFPFQDATLPLPERVQDLVSRLSLEEKIAQMIHDAPAVERLGVPPYNWWSEGLHGVARAGRATVFPQAIGLAASFDTDLLHRVGVAVSDEARAKHHAFAARGNYARYSGLTYWTPNVNIFRDPRWGRGQETYGEDPHLTATLGVTLVRAFQGDDSRYLKLAACAKHYAVHSGPEGERHSFDARASAYDLYDTYLPAFHALVKAGVESVMGAYNRTNGEPCCGSHHLLIDILRGAWGFEGHVVSDCWALADFHTGHHVTQTPEESAALALRMGCDLNCGAEYPHLLGAVQQGLITEADVDRSLSRLMTTRMKLGMFDPPEQVPYTQIPGSVIGSDTHQMLAREAAVKSCVLLKNEGVLPLPKDLKTIYVTGPSAASVDVLLGNYYGASPRLVTLLEGIVGAVSDGTVVEYRQGCQYSVENINPVDWVTYEASQADVVIACMGIGPVLEGEEGDAIASPDRGDRLDLDLPENQMRFLRKLHERGSKIVLVMTGGSPITMTEALDLADAVLWVWYPGEQGGNAVADVLFGDGNPSGRLPITFPRSLEQLPPYADYGMQGRTYRYMEHSPLFPFGFGLSYTRYAFRDVRVSASEIAPGQSVSVQVTVENVGERAGDEIVQVYTRRQDGRGPRQALKGFRRVNLDAGESATVDFTLEADAFAVIGDDGTSSVPPGDVDIIAGGACPIGRSEELGAPRPVSATVRIA